MHSSDVPQDLALRCQLALIAGNDDAFIEVRQVTDGQFRPAYCHTRNFEAGAHSMLSILQGDVEMFVGAAPRVCNPGSGSGGCGTDADVERSWCLWADCDTDEAVGALDSFQSPSLIVSSGAGLHCYWQLSKPAPAHLVKQANRRIAFRLGSDACATNPSRILRLIGSWNPKRSARVVCVHLDPVSYRPGALVNRLPDHPAHELSQERAQRNVVALPGLAPEWVLEGPLRRLRAAQEGQRNRTLYWAARIARQECSDLEGARELLTEVGLEIGLDGREIAGTIASAFRSAA